jgi:HPr kinase/phosphorylase
MTARQGKVRSRRPENGPGRSQERKVSLPGSEAGSLVIISAGLLNIFGVGTLIIGDSGVGKSESSLELISRGHKFISDDVVEVCRNASGRLYGRSPRLTRSFMEIRGLGIINIKEIFGARAILDETPIDLVVRLKKWSKKMEIDRLGLKFPEDYFLAGIRVPQLHIPVAPGRNIATLIEVACRVFVLRRRGYQAARDIVKRLDRKLARKNEKSS